MAANDNTLPLTWKEVAPTGNPLTYKATGNVTIAQVEDDDDFTHYTFTLQPGAALTTECGGKHDEGWWSSGVALAQGEDEWLVDVYTDGVDCDGRNQSHRAGSSLGGVNALGRSTIDWGSVSLRDYFAEAAGY